MTQSEVRQMFVRNNPGVRIWGRKGYWYRCAICGGLCGRPGREKANIPENMKMEVDHITPWSNGGSDEMYNLQAVCRLCNRSKSNKTVMADVGKMGINTVLHPVDTLVKTPMRKALRQNKILKGLGITSRR